MYRGRKHPPSANRGSAASAGGQDCPRRMIGAEVIRAPDRQQIGKARTGAIDPALDGPHRTIANCGCLLVGEPGRTDQDKGFPLVGRQLRERYTKLLELDPALLLGMRFQRLRVASIRILDFAPTLAVLRPKQIAQYREEPRRHICPRLERMDVGHRAQERFLDQIVGAVDVPAQRYCKGPQARNSCEHRITYGWSHVHRSDPLPGGTSSPLAPSTRSNAASFPPVP